MRLVLLVLFPCFLLAITPQIAFEKAKRYEENGDLKKALFWYKKSALLSLKKDQNNTKMLPFYAKDELINYKKAQKSYEEFFQKHDDNETEETIGQMITGLFGLQTYQKNYLLPVVYDSSNHEDRKHFETQFQISFKKNMFENLFGFNEKYAFAYSQTSWWQTFKDSKPFRQTSYRPEIFVYGFYGGKALRGYQMGLIHESNGRDFEKSRSWNRLYLKTFWQMGDFFISPQVWYRLPEREKRSINDDKGDDNPNIENYLGYGDLSITYPWRKNVFSIKLRNNLKFDSENRGSLEFEWTFPLWSKSFFGYLNYFTGYASSLEDYNTHANRIGLGFALSR